MTPTKPAGRAGGRAQKPLPPLAPQTEIGRPLSLIEYYHASVGSSRHTIEPPREVIVIAEGRGQVPGERWQHALAAVALVNPGLRLRMLGHGLRARWRSDGAPPRLRLVADCVWDGKSDAGADFIHALPLNLADGPSVELIIATKPATTPATTPARTLVILRVLHAVMDGRGILHALEELFRALRGEALVGTNASFSDVDLMRAQEVKKVTSPRLATVALTGVPAGVERGDTWRRIRLRGRYRDLLPRVAVAAANFAHQHSALPAVIAVPVDLRRHLPGLNSTLNFSSMVRVPLYPGEGTNQFRRKLARLLRQRTDAYYAGGADYLKLLPLTWMDYLLSRRAANYTTKVPLETVLIASMGDVDAAAFSCPGFSLDGLYGVPVGSTNCGLIAVGDQLDIILGTSRVLASNGRLDAFLSYLERQLQSPSPPP